MNPIDPKLTAKRHTLAHLLAAAVLKLYPDAKRTIGPAAASTTAVCATTGQHTERGC